MVRSMSAVFALIGVFYSAHLAKPKCIIAPFSSNVSTSLEAKSGSLRFIKINPEVEFNTVVNFVSRAFDSRSLNCSEVIGVVGELDLTAASIIHILASRANLNITLVSAVAPSTFLPPTNLAFPNLHHMNPLTHYVEALAAFLDHLNWTRIGLISENTPYHQFTAELVQQKLAENPERRIIPFISVNNRDNKTKVIKTFKGYQTDVIFVLAGNSIAHSLIQEAERVGFTWPEYAWILFEASFQLPLSQAGVIVLSDQTNLKESDYFSTSISAFSGNNGEIKFRDKRHLNNISITQIISSTIFRKQIGLYNSETKQLSGLESSFMSGAKPRGSVLKIMFHNQYFVLRASLITLVSFALLIFVSIVLVLYLYFHKEPEIKATSVAVSLSMFLGCYTLILYMPLLVLVNEHRLCNLILWLGPGGIPIPLILSTIFFKVLRIFWIFCDPVSYKKKFFYDPCLFLYIILLMIPSFLILTIWSSFDTYTFMEQNSTQTGFIFVYPVCSSRHTAQFSAVHLFYWILMCITLISFALKTSKIQYKHFRDTKATNAFIFLTVYFVLASFIFWTYIRQLEQSTSTLLASDGLLYVLNSVLVVLCQNLLFVSKVYPPLKRKVTRNQVKSKHTVASTTSY